MKTDFVRNPFVVKSPEDISADEVNRLFVDVLTDLQKVEQAGHVMLNGPRGCGKSMIFRFLEADCQVLHRSCQPSELPYFAVLIRIRNTSPNLTELRRLADAPIRNMLNEHFLTMYVASTVFKYLSKTFEGPAFHVEDRGDYYDFFANLVARAGGKAEPRAENSAHAGETFRAIHKHCDRWYHDTITFARALTFGLDDRPPFRGPICGYMDFLFPLLCRLKSLAFFPDAPLYLLLDDADLLSYTQTRILNSWLATRTSDAVSLKVSTQLTYRTYRTATGTTVDSPHDYSEVNMIDVYTTHRGRYMDRVREIVRKRLEMAGIDRTPDEFFPCFEQQEARIKEIGRALRDGTHRLSHKGYRASDDVVRYARPEYFRELAGSSKSTPSYLYAGFEHLVHISSGLIRYFLEPAGLMFGEQQSRQSGQPVEFIEPGVQHEMVTRAAEELMTTQFKKVEPEDPEIEQSAEAMSDFQQKKYYLQSLLEVLGGTFRAKLLSDDAERRVFSVAFTDAPDPALLEIFELGLQAGYFHRRTIGNKDGTGRTPMYILTRRLAPYFKLDPSSFAGYLHVTSERLWAAVRNPRGTLRTIKREGAGTLSEDEGQLSLFADDTMVRP